MKAVRQLFSAAELDAATNAVTFQPAQSMLGSDDRDNRVTFFVLRKDVGATRTRALRDLRSSRNPLVVTALSKIPGKGDESAAERLFRVVVSPER